MDSNEGVQSGTTERISMSGQAELKPEIKALSQVLYFNTW